MKKIPRILIIFNILILISNIGIALYYKLPIYLAILSASFYTFIILCLYKYPIRTMFENLIKNLKLVKNIIFLLVSIGVLIPLLFKMGALPNFIYYSVGVISSFNILVFAFVLATVLSMITGTSLGTLTILVPLFLSISISINLPAEIIVGALISGSYFGDRASPLAASAHLTASITRTPVRNNIKFMLKGSIIPYMLSIILFYFLGKDYLLINTESIDILKFALESDFAIHWLYLSPLFLLIILILFKISFIKSITITYMASLVIYAFQGFVLNDFIHFSLNGYSSINPLLAGTIKSSGLVQMFNILLVIFSSTVLNSLIEVADMLKEIIEPYLRNIKTYAQLTHKAAFLSIILSLITCNQTLTSIITGNYMNQYYDQLKVNRSYLAKTIGDTGLNIVGLIPWNVNGLLIAALTGVPTLSYVKYSFFLLLLPIYAIFIHPLGKKCIDNDYQ